jgi:ubiquinone/menaquinone biosynthesis C-methylase UbiE
MTDDPLFSRVKDTFEHWAMYEAVVEHNYMLHAELIEALGGWAADYGRPLAILDLGCGDAYLPTNAFRAAEVEQYAGVDLSESAVVRAREHLALWPGRATVTNGNMLAFLTSVADASKNLVLASYSLHHFATPQKFAILSECRRTLGPGGTLIWIDSVMREGESRDDYLGRQTHAFRHDWTGLTEEQREKVVAHVWESDFPESARWMNTATATLGFGPGEMMLENEFFAAWKFCRA